jgi:hypothetical protein
VFSQGRISLPSRVWRPALVAVLVFSIGSASVAFGLVVGGVVFACYHNATGVLRLELAEKPCNTTASNALFRETRISWNQVGQQGLQGIQGLKGDQGIQGVQGEKGEQGIQGIQGVKGDTGETGGQGIQGLKGDQGVQGIQGVKGDKGESGSQGIQGTPGAKGDQGIQGVPGPQGAAGTGLTKLEDLNGLPCQMADAGTGVVSVIKSIGTSVVQFFCSATVLSALSIGPGSQVFPNTDLGQTTTLSFTVTNLGLGPSGLVTFSLTNIFEGAVPFFTIGPNPCNVDRAGGGLPAGHQCTIDLTFAPTASDEAPGVITGALTVSAGFAGGTPTTASASFSAAPNCPTHSNGLGQTYVYCRPLGTPGPESSSYTVGMALAAANAWPNSTLATLQQCVAGNVQATAMIDGVLHLATWQYLGPPTGFVHVGPLPGSCPIGIPSVTGERPWN